MIKVKKEIIKAFHKKYLKFLIIFYILLILLAGYLIYFEKKYENKFYPGISINGENFSGKKYQETYDYFRQKADLIEKNGITFNINGTNGVKEIPITLFSKGFTTDRVAEHFSLDKWKETIQDAYSYGRKGSIWQIISEQYITVFKGKDFKFSPSIQQDTIKSFFDDELFDFLSEPVPARFVVKNNDISIVSETLGEKIDSNKIIHTLEKKLLKMDAFPADIETEIYIPTTTKEKLERFLDFAKNIKNYLIISFNYNGYSWKINGNTLVAWLRIKDDGLIGIDENKLENNFNNKITYYIDSPMVNSHFEIKDGKLTEISKGRPGNAVNIKKNAENIENIINKFLLGEEKLNLETPEIKLSVEITTEEPRVTQETIKKYRIKELVGLATTNFQGGSLDRQHNIETGVSKLNGILIAPGEEFSAVNAIGEITEEAGFVKEYVINEGKTQKELGGGLCQVATTLFRTALNAGLPITERVNHRYVISYYGAGLDATIYGPHPDLRFVNDTGNYLLLQGRAINNEVILELYGKKDGRTVEISKPVISKVIPPAPPKYIASNTLPLGQTKCSEIPHNGVTADAIYTVKYANGEVNEQKFHSVYQPWQKVCLIGIGDKQ